MLEPETDEKNTQIFQHSPYSGCRTRAMARKIYSHIRQAVTKYGITFALYEFITHVVCSDGRVVPIETLGCQSPKTYMERLEKLLYHRPFKPLNGPFKPLIDALRDYFGNAVYDHLARLAFDQMSRINRRRSSPKNRVTTGYGFLLVLCKPILYCGLHRREREDMNRFILPT